jgi:hypothetical protein
MLNCSGMAVYVYSQQQIENRVNKARRFRLWFCAAAFVILVFVSLLYFYSPSSPILRVPIWGPLLGILVTLFLPWNWRSWPNRLRSSLKDTSIEVSPGSVVMSGPSGFNRQFSTGEILRGEEPSLEEVSTF